MRSVYQLQRQGSPELGHFFDGESALDCRIHPYPKPTIALAAPRGGGGAARAGGGLLRRQPPVGAPVGANPRMLRHGPHGPPRRLRAFRPPALNGAR
ncbi:MAG: hypothetical protein H6946_09550 [Thauera sp.]|nr:hypothetical protein [Thauera sp.]